MSTALVEEPLVADRPPESTGSSSGGFERWLPLIVSLVAVAVMLLAVGTSLLDILRYGAYAVWGVVLPGTLLYRAVRRVPHSLVDDLTMGSMLGLAAELVAFCAFSLLRVQHWLLLWPLLVVVPFLAVPRLRRHWRRPPGYRQASLAWCWAMATLVVFFAACLVVAAMAIVPTVPAGGDGSWYVVDIQYLLGLVGELKNHFPPHTPQVSTEPLHYHWFAFAHDATASLMSGVDTPVAFLRFGMLGDALLGVLAMGVAGWRLFNRPWAGVVAAMLVFGVGEVAVLPPYPAWGETLTMSWTGPSMFYSWVFTVAMIIVVADRLTPGGLRSGAIGRSGWPLILLFGVASIGAKSSSLPPALAGIGLVGLVELVRRRRIGLRVLVIAVLLGVAFLFGTIAIFAGENHGLWFHPFFVFRGVVDPDARRGAAHYVLGLGAALVAYAVFELARFAGIVVLGWLAGKRRSAAWGFTEWFLLGGFVAGVAGTLLLAHPTDSELHFVRSGLPFGALLAGAGYAALVDRVGATRRAALLSFAGPAAVASAVTFVFWWRLVHTRNNPVSYTVPGLLRPVIMPFVHKLNMGGLLQIITVGLALAVVGLLAVGGWQLGRRRWVALQGLGGLVVLSALMAAGTPALPQEAYFGGRTLTRYHLWQEQVDQDRYQTARWLRGHTGPDDVLATNIHVYRGNVALTFWLNAWSERRTLVGSWGYVPRVESLARDESLHPSLVPFWDPAKLADNDVAFYEPTQQRIDWLKRQGVHWMVVDRDIQRESGALADYATLRYQRGPMAVYEIR